VTCSSGGWAGLGMGSREASGKQAHPCIIITNIIGEMSFLPHLSAACD